jgi:hypothetical protein
MSKACVKDGVLKNAYKFFVGKPERKTTFGRSGVWEINIKTGLEIGYEGVDWLNCFWMGSSGGLLWTPS